MRITHNKIKFSLGLILISLIFLYLRLKTFNHLLMWDEAWNILSLKAFLSQDKANPFYWGFFYHPPLYMMFAKLLAPFKAGIDLRLEFLSLLFSYVGLLIMYVWSTRIGGLKYAFLSGLFLSLMPMSIGYDTWIKRDGLASALGYLAIFLLLERRFIWCALALSLALLAKENALFFILSVTCLLFLLKEKKKLVKIGEIYIIVLILTSWWYIRFSTMTNTFFDSFFSIANNVSTWGNSPLYYFQKLWQDLGLPILFFFLVGIGYGLHLSFQKKKYRWSWPVLVTLCVYIPISFCIALKAPWLCLSARPAMAMVAAGGALWLLKMARRSKFLFIIFAVFFISSIVSGFAFSYSQYHIKTYPRGWYGAYSSKELAFYLNKNMRENDRLMISEFAYWKTPICAVFSYYWKEKPMVIFQGQGEINSLIQKIRKDKISWLVIVDSLDPEYNFHSLARDAMNSPLGRPTIIGWSLVWKTDSFWLGSDRK